VSGNRSTLAPDHPDNGTPQSTEEFGLVQWKVFCRSEPGDVYRALSTSPGRVRFWAQSTQTPDGVIEFVLPDGRTDKCQLERAVPNQLYRVKYFGRTVTFTLLAGESGGTELTLTSDRTDAQADAVYVSLLLRLKASVDFGVDLRNHDNDRTIGYADS
jgi:hypothetical protein